MFSPSTIASIALVSLTGLLGVIGCIIDKKNANNNNEPTNKANE